MTRRAEIRSLLCDCKYLIISHLNGFIKIKHVILLTRSGIITTFSNRIYLIGKSGIITLKCKQGVLYFCISHEKYITRTYLLGLKRLGLVHKSGMKVHPGFFVWTLTPICNRGFLVRL